MPKGQPLRQASQAAHRVLLGMFSMVSAFVAKIGRCSLGRRLEHRSDSYHLIGWQCYYFESVSKNERGHAIRKCPEYWPFGRKSTWNRRRLRAGYRRFALISFSQKVTFYCTTTGGFCCGSAAGRFCNAPVFCSRAVVFPWSASRRFCSSSCIMLAPAPCNLRHCCSML